MIFKFLVSLVVALQLVAAFDVTDEAKGSQNFAIDLFKSQYNKAENSVFSPFSIRVLLAILYQSTDGMTETELREKAFFGDKISTLRTQLNFYQSLWTNPSLKLANKIFLTRGGEMKRDFLRVVHIFDSEIEQVDFRQSVEVADKMNQFVEKKTNGLIKNLVSPADVTPDTAMFLLNTLYFKANWKSQYSADHVQPMDFTNYKGQTKKISFMYQYGTFRTAELASIDATVIVLPYEDDTNMEFVVVLPHSGSTIETVLEKFTTETIIDFRSSSRVTDMFFSMPIFETESSMDIKVALQKLGIDTLFDDGVLDLMKDRPMHKVDDARQKSKIIVNTKGTEAASATFMKAVPFSAGTTVLVNRPFVYMVMTKDNHIPLFVGHFSE